MGMSVAQKEGDNMRGREILRVLNWRDWRCGFEDRCGRGRREVVGVVSGVKAICGRKRETIRV